MTLTTKHYEVVEKNNKEFWGIVDEAWKEINSTMEQFKKSDFLLVKNEQDEIVATCEMACYNKNHELDIIENEFNFKQFQVDSVELIYIDKLAIEKSHRAKLDSMKLLMKSLFHYTEEHEVKTGKRIVLVALIQSRFCRNLKRFLDLDIHELSEARNGEIPILIDLGSEENAKKLKSNTWSQFI